MQNDASWRKAEAAEVSLVNLGGGYFTQKSPILSPSYTSFHFVRLAVPRSIRSEVFGRAYSGVEMSGAGEILAGCAAAASISQLLANVLRTSQVLARFYKHAKDAPSELRHLQTKILLLQHCLEFFNSYASNVHDDTVLPPAIRVLLQSVLRDVEDSLSVLHKACEQNDGTTMRKRDKVKFALVDRETLSSLLAKLKNSETTLIYITNLLNIHISSVTLDTMRGLDTRIGMTNVLMKNIAHASTSIYAPAQHGSLLLQGNRNVVRPRRSPRRGSPQSYRLPESSLLRWLGISFAFSTASGADEQKFYSVRFGFQVPAWLLAWLPWRAISYSYRICRSIQYQNPVPIDSPFLSACRRGDVPMIQQYIEDNQEFVNCRSICSGKTPLLLAIESVNLVAIKMLLDAGASPDLGDDQQILPIFAALGYEGIVVRNGFKSPFVQFPPQHDDWLSIMQLLIEYGASVHEVVSNRTITMLNLSRDSYGPETTVRFFRLLHEECYTDFDLVNDQGYSALLTAIRSGPSACSAIDFLARTGVPIGRIFEDGRTALHIAAEMASDAVLLKHLYNAYDIHKVNRQDQWGWTPLHYAVKSDAKHMDEDMGKLSFLVEKGADPHVLGWRVSRGRRHLGILLREAVTPMQYAELFGQPVRQRLEECLGISGISGMSGVIDEDIEEEVFFDAEEGLP